MTHLLTIDPNLNGTSEYIPPLWVQNSTEFGVAGFLMGLGYKSCTSQYTMAGQPTPTSVYPTPRNSRPYDQGLLITGLPW